MKLFKPQILFTLLLLNISVFQAFAEDSLKLETSSTAILQGTNLSLIVDKGVEASISDVGDLFVSRVKESAYSPDGKTLLIPKGSWVTGRVVSVKAPGRISRAGKLSLELDGLTTLTGELFPLNAVLSFERGKVTEDGNLDPQTGFKDKAIEPTKKLLSNNAGQIISIATLGIPVVGTLLVGSTKALISRGDNIGLLQGETFQIELKDSSLYFKE